MTSADKTRDYSLIIEKYFNDTADEQSTRILAELDDVLNELREFLDENGFDIKTDPKEVENRLRESGKLDLNARLQESLNALGTRAEQVSRQQALLSQIGLVIRHARFTQGERSIKAAQDLADAFSDLHSYVLSQDLAWDQDILNLLDLFSEAEDESGLKLIESVSYSSQAIRDRAKEIGSTGRWLTQP